MNTTESTFEILGYQQSPNFISTDSLGRLPIDLAHQCRTAINIHGMTGVYLFRNTPYSMKPAVCVAKATTPDEAREIHRSIWNLNIAPFLIIILPDHVRVYNSFSSPADSQHEDYEQSGLELESIHELLKDLKADYIDCGQIWSSKERALEDDRRVNTRLLSNLETLRDRLIKSGLNNKQTAHSLIGKYIYINYLFQRDILTAEWMESRSIKVHEVLSERATVSGLARLTQALEDRFNGSLFPLDIGFNEIQDRHVQLVASVMKGAQLESADNDIRQLCFDFSVYNFELIPVETLSAIYEQFIDPKDRKDSGAVYTPEYLADFLLSELQEEKPLTRGIKVLDPACGSGVFLALTYQRLIEQEISATGTIPSPTELKRILLESIYGVERNPDACNVTIFSLILTLLSYSEPRQLHAIKFKFPSLKNQRIFESDFFDPFGKISGANPNSPKFDWIVGNPPWVELDDELESSRHTLNWIRKHKKKYPISKNQAALAFTWAATNLSSQSGIIGFVLPTTALLFNHYSKKFRQSFFANCIISKVINLSNLRERLFDSADVSSSMLCIYKKRRHEKSLESFIHYAPFGIHQSSPTAITVHEFEISYLDQDEAKNGDSVFWKLAQWGHLGDRRTLKAIASYFPTTLKNLIHKNSWNLTEGPQLRPSGTYFKKLKAIPKINTKAIKNTLFQFSIPTHVLEPIPPEMCYLRRPGAIAGVQAPLLLIPQQWMKGIAFSHHNLVARNRSECTISSDKKSDENILRALSVYLNSSLVAYFMFFETAQWGIDQKSNRRVRLQDIRNIPIPKLDRSNIQELSNISSHIETIEPRLIEVAIRAEGETLTTPSTLENYLKGKGLKSLTAHRIRKSVGVEIRTLIDSAIYRIFGIPEEMQIIIDEFVSTRCLLDSKATTRELLEPASKTEILTYGNRLKKELDIFIGLEHHILFQQAKSYILCLITLNKEDQNTVQIEPSNADLSKALSQIKKTLNRPISRWISLQYGLKVISNSSILLFKSPERINWLSTQAIEDAAWIISDSI